LTRSHFEGIVAREQTRRTIGFLEALNGLFQSARRKARCLCRFNTFRTVIFLIAGELDFSKLNPHVAR
jgi:transposase